MSLEPIELIRGYAGAEQQGEALSLGLAKSAVARRFSALRQPETILPLASHSQARDGLPKRLVLDSSIDFGRDNVSVAECSLYQTEVASLAEEPHGKGMAKRVDGKVPGDASYFKPVPKSQLDLARAKPIAAAGAEEWYRVAGTRSLDVPTEQSAKLGVQEDRLFTSAFCANRDSSLTEVHITGVQTDERAEPDAGSEQDREHREVSARNCSVGSGNRGEQRLRLIGRQVAGRSSIRRCRADQPCGVFAQIPCVREKPEEHSQGRLGSIDGERGSPTVTIGQEACERVGIDDADLDITLEPASQLAQITQVSLPCALAFAICPELRVEAFDGCRELHGFTPLQSDSQATSMNALLSERVNSIMRTICLFGELCDLLGSTVRDVAATQALCAPISLEVSIDA